MTELTAETEAAETPERFRVPSKPDARAFVATFLKGWLEASDLTDMGLDASSLTKAEVARMQWAMEDMQRRLAKIAGVEE
jgi:hypothetical protein